MKMAGNYFHVEISMQMMIYKLSNRSNILAEAIVMLTGYCLPQHITGVKERRGEKLKN